MLIAEDVLSKGFQIVVNGCEGHKTKLAGSAVQYYTDKFSKKI
jgi:hypothetical protein